MVRFPLLSLFLLIPFISQAANREPWFGNDYEVGLQLTVLYQNYDKISSPHHHHHFKHHAKDVFGTLSAEYPFKRYCGQFEVTGARTRHQKYLIDNFRITGRYQWLSEFEGDPYNFVIGIMLDEPMTRALHDISSFHHGHIEGEAFLSYGKSYGRPCANDYVFRWWNVLGLGGADKGSLWLRGDLGVEYKDGNNNTLRGFVNTLWGLGRDDLNPEHFAGYGNIKHRSVDVGLRYGYSMGCWGILRIEYARRVYAFNFPKDVNLFLFEYYLPFGDQEPCSY